VCSECGHGAAERISHKVTCMNILIGEDANETREKIENTNEITKKK
jgi:hypothetical protein